MRIHQDEQFVALGFSFIGSEYKKNLTLTDMWAYLILRRYIVRTKSDKNCGAFYKEGFLVARISQQKIADLIGVSRKAVNSALTHLEKLEWLKKKKVGDYEKVYLLGQRITDKDDPNLSAEAFFADEQIRQALMIEDKERDRLEEEKKRKHSEEIKQLKDEMSFPLPSQPHTPCNPNFTPSTTPPLHPKNRELRIENNRIEKETKGETSSLTGSSSNSLKKEDSLKKKPKWGDTFPKEEESCEKCKPSAKRPNLSWQLYVFYRDKLLKHRGKPDFDLPESPDKTMGKEMRMLKMLAKEYGHHNSMLMIMLAILDWDALKSRHWHSKTVAVGSDPLIYDIFTLRADIAASAKKGEGITHLPNHRRSNFEDNIEEGLLSRWEV